MSRHRRSTKRSTWADRHDAGRLTSRGDRSRRNAPQGRKAVAAGESPRGDSGVRARRRRISRRRQYPQQARRALSARRTDRSRRSRTYTRVADHWLREGLYGKAAAHYKRVLKLRPNDEAALLQLVQASIRQGSLVEAKGYLRIARDAREARGDRAGRRSAHAAARGSRSVRLRREAERHPRPPRAGTVAIDGRRSARGDRGAGEGGPRRRSGGSARRPDQARSRQHRRARPGGRSGHAARRRRGGARGAAGESRGIAAARSRGAGRGAGVEGGTRSTRRVRCWSGCCRWIDRAAG